MKVCNLLLSQLWSVSYHFLGVCSNPLSQSSETEAKKIDHTPVDIFTNIEEYLDCLGDKKWTVSKWTNMQDEISFEFSGNGANLFDEISPDQHY